MDEDMEKVQIVFAQRLASGNPTIRNRALKQLQNFIKKETKNKSFSKDALAKLCKGLHYTMWMQDKMLLQEELAENICDLIDLYPSEEQAIEFINSLIFSLSKEWSLIDRWRMDKFLMFIRRLFRHIFNRLKKFEWDKKLTVQYIELFCNTLVSFSSNICESLKFHTASIFLDELDCADDLTEELVLEFLIPYINLLKEKISVSFFQSICTEIFQTILYDFSAQLIENEKINVTNGIKFNYSRIAELLFNVGSSSQIITKRRKHIYSLSKKFELAAKGIDPFPKIEIPSRKRKR